MIRKIRVLLCISVMLFSACGNGELWETGVRYDMDSSDGSEPFDPADPDDPAPHKLSKVYMG